MVADLEHVVVVNWDVEARLGAALVVVVLALLEERLTNITARTFDT